MKHKSFFFILLGLGVSISGYYLYRFWLGFPSGTLDLPWSLLTVAMIGAGIALQLLGHYLRAYKWRLLLSVIRPTKTRTLFKGVAVGFLYNSLLPFRIGEFIRADLVGRAMSISRTVVFGTIVFERVIDGLILVTTAAILITIYPKFNQSANLWPILAGLIGVLFAAILMLGLIFTQNKRILRLIRSWSRLLNDRLKDRLRFVFWSTIYGLRLIAQRANLPAYLALSVLMWGCYLASTALIILSLVQVGGKAELVFSSVVSYLSVAIPSGPAYLGTYHYFFTSIISPLVSPARGLFAVSIATWAAMTLPIALIGVALIAMGHRAVRLPSEAERLLSLHNKLYRDYDISKELSHFLDAYFAGAELSHALSQAEMTGRLSLLRTFKGGSNAITMLVGTEQEARVRKMTLPQHAEKLKAQHDWLKARSDIPHLPKVLHEDLTAGQYSFEIQYEANFLPFFDFIHSRTDEENRDVIERVVNFMRKDIYDPKPPENAEQNVRDYIDTKVIGKMRDTMALNNAIATLSEYDSLKINGTRYDNWEVVIQKILSSDHIMKDLMDYSEGPIHGDLTIDNIIVDPGCGDFIVLDPNNENQVSAPVVDMAKLYQSLHSGYEFLCNLDRTEVRDDTIRFEEHVSTRYTKLLAVLDAQLKRELTPAEHRTILFHEAVHYCRMLTYRAKINPDTLPAFYGIAVRLLNEFYYSYDS
jgi:uncharacterized protein (TIRG00374 family)